MARVHNTLRLTTDDGVDVNINIATISYVENDIENGYIVNGISSATELYKLAQLYHTKTLYINDLVGLRLTFSETTIANYYADPYLKEPLQVYRMKFQAFNGNIQVAKDSNPVCAPSTGFLSKNIPITGNEPCLCFAWDTQKNELTLVAKNMEIEQGTTETNSFFKYTAVNYEPKVGRPRNGEFIPNPNTLPRTLIAPYRQIYNVGQYMFGKYSELTGNPDADDKEKQEPGKWEYPNGPGGPSKPGGGDGDQSDTSNPIPEDDIIDGLSSDFVKLYKITKANLTALSEYMLQDNFLTNIKKLYADPMDAIISLNTFPINATGTEGTITTSGVSTGINAVRINNSIIDIDCGTIAMKEYWGSFLDYETKISLFLPYVGIQPISTDDFMNDIIHVVYRVDLLSGGFVVFVKNSKGIVHQTTGNMAYHMPVTSIDYSRMYASLITGAVGLAGAAVTGGASIAAAKTATAAFAAKEAFVGSAITTGANTMQNFHPSIQMSGNFGGNTGICSNKKPYLIIERPVPNVPANYSAIKGNTSNVTVTLGNCSGFTQISDMQIKYISATDAEKTQILNLLTSGVYF